MGNNDSVEENEDQTNWKKIKRMTVWKRRKARRVKGRWKMKLKIMTIWKKKKEKVSQRKSEEEKKEWHYRREREKKGEASIEGR